MDPRQRDFPCQQGNGREDFCFGPEIDPFGPKFWHDIKPLRQFP